MMNILYYDCFSGISGDMNLAAMVDLGIDPFYLTSELSKLNLSDFFELKVKKDSKFGISGTRVDVEVRKKEGNIHRNLKMIEGIIESSYLDEEIKKTSISIFQRLASAESAVHGKSIDEIHFHEVGGIDAIVDIVGAAICYHTLRPDEVWSSAIEVGGGFVSCAHGKFPVPAPATVELLKGIPVKYGAVYKETTTPTGAAIISTLADRFIQNPSFIIGKTAYGIGHQDFQIPNLLRIQSGNTLSKKSSFNTEHVKLLQCNIDDMTGEMLGYLVDIFLTNGAQDIHFTPIIMKKNRPATSLSVLCAEKEEETFKELIFKHTTTLGIKSISIEKTKLDTFFQELRTPIGTVSIKQSVHDGQIIRSKPEFEDVKKLAEIHSLSLYEVYRIIGKCNE